MACGLLPSWLVSTGVLELGVEMWHSGVLELWKSGVLEWKSGDLEFQKSATLSPFFFSGTFADLFCCFLCIFGFFLV